MVTRRTLNYCSGTHFLVPARRTVPSPLPIARTARPLVSAHIERVFLRRKGRWGPGLALLLSMTWRCPMDMFASKAAFSAVPSPPPAPVSTQSAPHLPPACMGHGLLPSRGCRTRGSATLRSHAPSGPAEPIDAAEAVQCPPPLAQMHASPSSSPIRRRRSSLRSVGGLGKGV